MIKFSQFILEGSIYIPPRDTTLNVDRKDMPQIDHKDIKHFLEHMKEHGVESTYGRVQPDVLTATQGEFNKKKITEIIQSMKNKTYDEAPILVSDDQYVIDGHHRWLAHLNEQKPIAVHRLDANINQVYELMMRYPRVIQKKLHEEASQCSLISQEHIKHFEILTDRLFKKFGMDFQFTKHFGERLSDGRNDPCITLRELAEFIKKIYEKHGRPLKDKVGSEVVLKDLQKDLNIPVSVEYDRKNDKIDVILKTIMRKKNFHSPDKVITY